MAMAELKRAETGVMVPQEDRAPLTFFEGIDFKLRAKGPSAGDNTVRQRLGELSNDLHGRGDFFVAHAKEYLRCFQPVTGVKFTNTTDIPTLFDQLKPTLERFDKDRQREVLEYLVHDATKSIVEKKQPRPTKSRRSDIADATRQEASGFLAKLEDVIMERLEPTPVAGQTQFDRFVKVPVRAGEAAAAVYLALQLGACTPIQPTISPDVTPPAITQTVPGIETPTPDQFEPTPTDVYHFGSGGPINQEKLQQMERQDQTVAKQIEWLNTWGDWYGSADPSVRPMTGDEARNDIVFYQWTGSDGSIHYKAAWKFDIGYPGYILAPPAINWEGLNSPVTAPAGHEIGPGQGPVKISTECLEGSELAKMGVPVGAQLAVEQGTGAWVMVYQDQVAARIDKAGVWRREIYQPRQVELVFAPDDVTVPDSCKVVPEATADNSLTLNGQPLPDGTVIDSYEGIVSITSGVYHQPTLLIAARAVAIEKLIPDPDMGRVDPYLLCYNVKLPSGDTMVIASIFDNTSQQGFQNTAVYELPGADVAGVTLDQTATQPTPIKVIRNSDFLALFTSGTIIGQQVLLPFAYDYPSTDRAVGENSWRGAIVAALKAGRLPSSGYFHSIYATPIGGEFVVPESLMP